MTEDTLDAILAIKIESTDDNDLKKVLKNLQDIDDLTDKLDDKKNFKKFVDSLSKEGKKPGTKGEQEATGADLESVAKALDKIIKEIGVDSEERDEDLSEDIEDIGEDIGDDVKRSQREIISSIEHMTKTIQSMVFITPNVRGLPSSQFGTMVEALGNTTTFYENLRINQKGKIGENKEEIMKLLFGEEDLTKFDEKMMELLQAKAIQGIRAMLTGDYGLMRDIVAGFAGIANSFDLTHLRQLIETGENEHVTLQRGMGGINKRIIPSLGLGISSNLSTIALPTGDELKIKKINESIMGGRFTHAGYAVATQEIGYEDLSKMYKGGPEAEAFMERYFYGGETPLRPPEKFGMSEQGWSAYHTVTNRWAQQQGRESPFEDYDFNVFWQDMARSPVLHDLTLAINKQMLENFDADLWNRELLSASFTQEMADLVIETIQEALEDIDLSQAQDIVYILGEAKTTADTFVEAAKQLTNIKGVLISTQTPKAIFEEGTFDNRIIQSIASKLQYTDIEQIKTQSKIALEKLVDLTATLGLKMGKNIDLIVFRDLINNASDDTFERLRELLSLLPVNNNVQGP